MSRPESPAHALVTCSRQACTWTSTAWCSLSLSLAPSRWRPSVPSAAASPPTTIRVVLELAAPTAPLGAPHVETAVLKGLAKLPADRYRTVEEFCAQLTGEARPSSSPATLPASAAAKAATDPETSGPGSFWQELKRRHVYQTAAVYAGVAWLLIEFADVTFPRLNLPASAVTFIVVVAILGFPLAIALAWVFEVTRDGIRRT